MGDLPGLGCNRLRLFDEGVTTLGYDEGRVVSIPRSVLLFSTSHELEFYASRKSE